MLPQPEPTPRKSEVSSEESINLPIAGIHADQTAAALAYVEALRQELGFEQLVAVKPRASGSEALFFLGEEITEAGPEGRVVKTVGASKRTDPATVHKFVTECRITCKLSDTGSPFFVPARRAFDPLGFPVLVMDRIWDDTLEKRMRRLKEAGRTEPLIYRNEIPRVLPLLIRMCTAMETMHHFGVAHRDIKPSNLFVSNSGAVKLFDFSEARDLEREQDRKEAPWWLRPLDGNPISGTLKYMDPAVVEDSFIGRRKADAFSLAATFYHFLTGRTWVPLEGCNVWEALATIHEFRDEHFVDFADDLGPELASILRKALRKSPRERYHPLSEFRRALEGLLASSNKE
jgi:serine/threonine protein kinase